MNKCLKCGIDILETNRYKKFNKFCSQSCSASFNNVGGGNCDMFLPTYKGKNKGNGRFSRRKRYAEGRSY